MADKKPFVPYADVEKVKRQLVKDNAQPRIKPPPMARKPQPGLAPPGMVGIRTDKRFALPKAPAPPKPEFTATQGNLKREFKSLVRNQTGKGHDIEI